MAGQQVGDHLPTCQALTMAEAFPDEPRPEEFSEEEWHDGLRIMLCDPRCPRLAGIKAFGRRRFAHLDTERKV